MSTAMLVVLVVVFLLVVFRRVFVRIFSLLVLRTAVRYSVDKMPGVHVQMLVQKLATLKPTVATKAKEQFEIGFAQFMAWKKKTGITPEEVARQILRRAQS